MSSQVFCLWSLADFWLCNFFIDSGPSCFLLAFFIPSSRDLTHYSVTFLRLLMLSCLQILRSCAPPVIFFSYGYISMLNRGKIFNFFTFIFMGVNLLFNIYLGTFIFLIFLNLVRTGFAFCKISYGRFKIGMIYLLRRQNSLMLLPVFVICKS